MNVDETLSEIKKLLFKKAAPPKVDPDPVVDPAEPVTDSAPTPDPVDPAVDPTPEPGQSEAEVLQRIKEAEEKLRADQEDLKKQNEEKFAAIEEENKNREEGLNKLLELVKFLADLPTDQTTEDKKNGIKAPSKKDEKLERMLAGMKAFNESKNN